MLRVVSALKSALGLAGAFLKVLRDLAACDPGALHESCLRRLPGEGGQRRRRLYYAARLGACGQGLLLMHDVWLVVPENLRLGDNVSVGPGVKINAGGGVEIGNDVMIGPDVKIWSANHRFDDPGRPVCEQGYEAGPVRIGSDVWIAAGSIILPGVAIGDHAVIGAGSVVTSDVPAWSVAAGNPARVIKQRGPAPQSS
jgi:maltose O-acetyltransferase